jgi:hypothetical protein
MGEVAKYKQIEAPVEKVYGYWRLHELRISCRTSRKCGR